MILLNRQASYSSLTSGWPAPASFSSETPQLAALRRAQCPLIKEYTITGFLYEYL